VPGPATPGRLPDPDAGPVVWATANVKDSLPRTAAAEALRIVLDVRPDVVGLQEWGPARSRLLRATVGEYRWYRPLLGGCPVGVRRARLEVLRIGSVALSGPSLADRAARRNPLVPPRLATVGLLLDRATGRRLRVVNMHLVAYAQRGGRYLEGRPRLVARHRAEHRRLQRIVDRSLRDGVPVHVLGDANFERLRLDGLVSAWDGCPDPPGTCGRQTIDDVWGPGPALGVRLLDTPSDHRAVLVTRGAQRV
jgi:hypothetical protein